eukprot:4026748-Ditylum_brightwellii.AAC.1
MKTGNGVGLFGIDITDILCAAAMSSGHSDRNNHNAKWAWHYLCLCSCNLIQSYSYSKARAQVGYLY